MWRSNGIFSIVPKLNLILPNITVPLIRNYSHQHQSHTQLSINPIYFEKINHTTTTTYSFPLLMSICYVPLNKVWLTMLSCVGSTNGWVFNSSVCSDSQQIISSTTSPNCWSCSRDRKYEWHKIQSETKMGAWFIAWKLFKG